MYSTPVLSDTGGFYDFWDELGYEHCEYQGCEPGPYPGYEAHDECADTLATSLGQSIESGLYNPTCNLYTSVLDQRLLAQQRARDWPVTSDEVRSSDWAAIYSQVRPTGIPNEHGAKLTIKTALNLLLWNSSATGHPDDTIVLNGVTWGFSLQYLGGPLTENQIEMHASGEKYLKHVQEYRHRDRERRHRRAIQKQPICTVGTYKPNYDTPEGGLVSPKNYHRFELPT